MSRRSTTVGASRASTLSFGTAPTAGMVVSYITALLM
ncbi:hypothetical protein HNR07_004768 [Nocardiopsis metallicus]|uniref:Uncharacterized protein n=1 Tax=Nocardiopsis metallicus TaxID=179819 RepID=A0A840WKV9_9ACTN|nr:hypothetical protein [Nocardiopsis metallicus]